MRDTGLVKDSADQEALVGAARSKFNFVMRNARSINVLLKKPFHGMPALQVHLRSHNGFHFTTKLGSGERGLRVLGDDGVEKRGEASVGIRGARLPQHFANHVDHPRAFGIDDDIITIVGFGGRKARAHDERTHISGRDVFVFGFGGEAFAVALQPSEFFWVSVNIKER